MLPELQLAMLSTQLALAAFVQALRLCNGAGNSISAAARELAACTSLRILRFDSCYLDDAVSFGLQARMMDM